MFWSQHLGCSNTALGLESRIKKFTPFCVQAVASLAQAVHGQSTAFDVGVTALDGSYRFSLDTTWCVAASFAVASLV